MSINELCLLWAFSIKKINRIIIGIDNINQLKENLNILKMKKKLIKKDLISKIDFKTQRYSIQEIGLKAQLNLLEAIFLIPYSIF